MAKRTAIAPRWAEWEVRGRHASVPGAGFDAGGAAPLPGVPILPQQFPNGALRLVVEFAFGADLTADPSTWRWTDVSTDVLTANGRAVDIQQGKMDARSTSGPAQITFTLDNRTNAYSKSPFSTNWPYVRRGVPVRARAVFNNDVTQSTILFQGRAASFQPGFDAVDGVRYAILTVTASGTLRRLGQGTQPLFSTMRQYTPTATNLVAYWPMEDASGAVSFAGGTAATTPMTISGTVSLHSSSAAACSDSLPVFTNGTALGWFPAYTNTGALQVRALVVWPAAGSALPDQTALLQLFTPNGTLTYFELRYLTGGALRLLGYAGLTQTFDSGAIAFAVDGTVGQVGFSLSQSGADIAVQVSYYAVGATSAAFANNTATGQTLGVADHLFVMPNGATNATIAFGHVTLQSQASNIFELAGPLNAYDGERCYDRVSRLLGLVGVSAVDVRGDGVNSPMRMGPQRMDSVLSLIRECEATDAAVVYDGHSDSLAFVSHLFLENRTTAITVDATTQLSPPFAPVDDDQQLRNSWAVSQRNGGTVSYTNTGTTSDPHPDQSSVNVGLYADSTTVNLFGNADGYVGVQTGSFGVRAQQDLASWLVNRDTPNGYRIPQFHLALHRNPELLNTVVTAVARSGTVRMDVANLSAVYPQMLPGTAQFLIVGYSFRITQFLWDTTVNVAPYEPFHVGVIAAASGDTGENVGRVDTVGSTLASPANAGAASLSVTSSDVSHWTTTADDFPLTIAVDGIAVTVTNITGAGATQTFTVDPATVTKSLLVNADVRLWNPPVIAPLGGS